MIDAAAVETIDTHGMARAYSRWPAMAREAYASVTERSGGPLPHHVVLAGMGGSGAISDLFESVLSGDDIHVDVVKGYHLPRTAGPGTLVVATSISGNTAETMHVLRLAVEAGCRTVSFSDGGLLGDYCSRRGLEHTRVRMEHSPRASLPAFLYTMLASLGDELPIRDADVGESMSVLAEIAPSISQPELAAQNASLSLAEWLPDIPLVYYPWGLRAAAIRFKNSLQENAKTHAMAEDVMEACHNGIVAWMRDSRVRPILIRGGDDHEKTKERWDILEDFFMQHGISHRVVTAPGKSILARLVGLMYMLDYASIYRAVMLGVDPTPVGPIEYVKGRLSP